MKKANAIKKKNDKVYFSEMTVVDRLLYILNHSALINYHLRKRPRSIFLTDALFEASLVLPNGKSRRALEYVVDHPTAEFHFGGTDAVGAAIKEAIGIMIAGAAA